ncbi:uncharacterized protein LOC143448300 isoform X2 [Clavelina lepadiformis]
MFVTAEVDIVCLCDQIHGTTTSFLLVQIKGCVAPEPERTARTSPFSNVLMNPSFTLILQKPTSIKKLIYRGHIGFGYSQQYIKKTFRPSQINFFVCFIMTSWLPARTKLNNLGSHGTELFLFIHNLHPTFCCRNVDGYQR